MVMEYLETLKTQGNWNYLTLSQKTGLSETTIRKVFTDPDNNPTIDTLSKLIAAMGGSLDKLIGIEVEMQRAQTEPDADGMQITGHDMRELRREMLAHQRESYERELANLRKTNEHLVGEKKILRRTLYVVLAVMIALMFTTILFLIYDLAHLDRGWIQSYYGVDSRNYQIDGILSKIILYLKEVFHV